MAITLNRYTGPPSQGIASGENIFTVPASVGNLAAFFIVVPGGFRTIGIRTPSVLVQDNIGNLWNLVPIYSDRTYTYIWGAYCCGATAGITQITVINHSFIVGGISIGFYDLQSTNGGALNTTAVGAFLSDALFVFANIPSTGGGVVLAAGLAEAPSFESGPILSFISANSPFNFEAMDSSALSGFSYINVAASAYYITPSTGSQTPQLNLSNLASAYMGAMSFIDAVPAATPIITPNGGAFATALTVTLTCSTPISVITYTTDGSIPEPGVHGTVYSGPITVVASEVITAIASAVGYANSILTSADFGIGSPEAFVAEVQITITYQNPGNYLYARDLDSWGDAGMYAENNGTPYAEANFTIGSITLAQPGAACPPLQHVVLYADAVGTLDSGGPSQPTVWVLPNEISDTAGIGFQQLVEVLQEPPVGQNQPSKSIQALRYPVNGINSYLASQFIHHCQIRIEFEPENAPNTLKSIAFKAEQD